MTRRSSLVVSLTKGSVPLQIIPKKTNRICQRNKEPKKGSSSLNQKSLTLISDANSDMVPNTLSFPNAKIESVTRTRKEKVVLSLSQIPALALRTQAQTPSNNKPFDLIYTVFHLSSHTSPTNRKLGKRKKETHKASISFLTNCALSMPLLISSSSVIAALEINALCRRGRK